MLKYSIKRIILALITAFIIISLTFFLVKSLGIKDTTFGQTRDFKDLARLHLATINGDKMEAAKFEKFVSGMNTKKSPFFYVSRLMVAQKYLAVGDTENANKILDAIINDKNAPASISATAQTLR